MPDTDVLPDEWRFLERPAYEVAPRLLGCKLVRMVDGVRLAGAIVETEAYDQTDEASHSHKGKTPRTEIMFGRAGYLYVYFTYGMHYCCNVVTGKPGDGSAVLIRALMPEDGVAAMSAARGGLSGVALTNGPAKLCQALGIGKADNGADLLHGLHDASLSLELAPPVQPDDIVVSERIGISRAKDVPWRFHIKDNPFVSR